MKELLARWEERDPPISPYFSLNPSWRSSFLHKRLAKRKSISFSKQKKAEHLPTYLPTKERKRGGRSNEGQGISKHKILSAKKNV